MSKHNFFKVQGGNFPSEDQVLDTKTFYRNAVEIYKRFDDWKDIDKFYFIPLYMEMTYACSGWVAEIARDPVWLGTFVRNTIKHRDLFTYKCPECGKTVLPYRYCGSPLSGRVDLEGYCECGWKGYEEVSGWRVRATALRDEVNKDKFRHFKFRLFHPKSAGTVAELLSFLELWSIGDSNP